MLFSGDILSQMRFEKPFGEPGYLPVIVNREQKPTYGTGIHTVTPAHNINDLQMSYMYDLPRIGCVDSKNGKLTKPEILKGLPVNS